MTRIPIQLNVYLFRSTPTGLEALLLHRIPERGGFWQCVTGGFLPNETLIQGARREVLEETGLDIQELKDSGYSFEYPINPKWKHKYSESEIKIVEHVFVGLVPLDSDVNISSEHDSCKWVKKKEALGLLTEFETLRTSFNAAYESIA